MPLYRLLERQSFDPEAVKAIVFAFEAICQERGFKPIHDDARREIVARTVIEFARHGVIDPEKLRDAASDVL